MQHDRIKAIGKQLERLWHERRLETVKPERRFPKDRVHGDVFSDFVDSLRGVRDAGIDELDGFEVRYISAPFMEEMQPDYVYEVGAAVLREVLDELRAEDMQPMTA